MQVRSQLGWLLYKLKSCLSLKKHVEYAKELAKQMHRDYVRVEVDDRSEKNWLQKSAKHKMAKNSIHGFVGRR